ncbi:unnamed protein product [Acanthoscelides obtectus]|uniref:Pre-C2HC domain-containing protein n=1 Tax=Acanthoscelides obtectus TaxID=200917 RepID=A0A9P0MF94_ACAOB|nr:unnamed protein product [Acanthoscelides obtectus]CAK1626273.1 hypothetical protein AOBTE_LOCUS3739 [Acanthoscelides obtectus]
MFSEQEIKGELEQRAYTPLHIIRLKHSGDVPMPLVVVILPKIEKSQQLFNEHELLGLAIRVEVQKNSRLIGQCHRCQRYDHAQSYCTAPPKCLKCASDHIYAPSQDKRSESVRTVEGRIPLTVPLADSPPGEIWKS